MQLLRDNLTLWEGGDGTSFEAEASSSLETGDGSEDTTGVGGDKTGNVDNK